jgi:hypothetical protein
VVRVLGFGFWVLGLGFRIEGLGFRVQTLLWVLPVLYFGDTEIKSRAEKRASEKI